MLRSSRAVLCFASAWVVRPGATRVPDVEQSGPGRSPIPFHSDMITTYPSRCFGYATQAPGGPPLSEAPGAFVYGSMKMHSPGQTSADSMTASKRASGIFAIPAAPSGLPTMLA